MWPREVRFRGTTEVYSSFTSVIAMCLSLRSKVLGAKESSGVRGGQVGTVVELLDGAYEVEFSDDEGKTYAELALAPDQLLVLHHRPPRAA
jgi:Domain of unknown function (DUF4926)